MKQVYNRWAYKSSKINEKMYDINWLNIKDTLLMSKIKIFLIEFYLLNYSFIYQFSAFRHNLCFKWKHIDSNSNWIIKRYNKYEKY
jgi:hypothetical protein